uniref:phage adaptor protein n=1 Tax=Rheinheimera sp. TaxID=1869214 RepID=UPI004047D4EE
MTFIELCQRVRQESGISGSGPVTVVNQTGILAKVVEWVRQADLDIQRLQNDWSFLWSMTDTTLTTDVRQYAMADLGLNNVSRIKQLNIGNQKLTEIPWELFRQRGYLGMNDRQQPTVYTFRPDGILSVFAVPNSNYPLSVEHYNLPQPLLLDGDVSLIPERFHDIIMHKALMYYASHEEDGNLLQVSSMRYENVLNELASACLPRMEFSRGGLY